MTITSVGYAGTITDENWRIMATNAIGSLFGADDYASFRVSAGIGDRAITVATGGLYGLGVRDYSDTPITLFGSAVASGSRWDLVVMRRNWATSTSTVTIIEGTSAKALPARNTGFEDVNDQPIALVRFQAGSTVVQEIVDLRCLPADGGLLAFDRLVLSYLTRVGTQVRIGNFVWTRTVDALGAPKWEYVDVTPDTGWVEITKNSGWQWSFGQQRRCGAQIWLRLAAGRAAGWSVGGGLATAGTGFRPDQIWYVTSSATAGKTEFSIAPGGAINASQASGGATSATIHATYPAPRPTS